MNIMKRFFALILLGAMVLTCGASAETHTLYEVGTDLIGLVDEMAHNQDYIGLLTADPEVSELLMNLPEADSEGPDAVYRSTLESFDSILQGVLGSVPNEGSGLFSDYLNEAFFSAFMLQFNAGMGASQMAASNIASASRDFIAEDFEENAILLYTYDSGVSFLVSFCGNSDGIVTAKAMPLFAKVPDLSDGSIGFFEKLDLETLK